MSTALVLFYKMSKIRLIHVGSDSPHLFKPQFHEMKCSVVAASVPFQKFITYLIENWNKRRFSIGPLRNVVLAARAKQAEKKKRLATFFVFVR